MLCRDEAIISRSTPAPVQIFLAEDNPGDVRLIREALKMHGITFDLHVFEDGEKALSFIGRMVDPNSSCPILLDLNLPKTDGRDILRQIKQIDRMKAVPVVVLSSSESPRDLADAASLGADRYVRKPTNLDEFMGIGAIARELILARS